MRGKPNNNEIAGSVRAVRHEGDNFNERRASQAGAGVAYDPESLCLGSEDYNLPRDRGTAPNHPESLWQKACRGEIPVSEIPKLFPRRVPTALQLAERLVPGADV